MLQTVAQQRPLGRVYLHHLIQPHLERFQYGLGYDVNALMNLLHIYMIYS